MTKNNKYAAVNVLNTKIKNIKMHLNTLLTKAYGLDISNGKITVCANSDWPTV
jgi:hypothetical protein